MFSIRSKLSRLALSLAFGSVIHTAQGETAAGSIAAELNVENGAATYSVPIETAPGRAGMQPGLALKYSSQSGNGTVGIGWAIAGLSSIQRCSATLAQDGFVGGLTFTHKDRYCLNGQRLIPVSGSNGAVGTEYKTEIDSFSRIHSVGGTSNNPDHWIVKTKAGEILKFGGSEGNAALALSSGTLSWSLRNRNDRTGNNAVNYSYVIDHNTQYLSQITYPGGRVDFQYTARSDINSGYTHGNAFSLRKKLIAINTYADNTFLKRYSLSYHSNPTITQLKSIAECDAGNHCKKPLEFEWDNTAATGFQTTHSSGVVDWGYGDGRQWADFNGDGLADYCRRVGGSNLKSSYVSCTLATSNGFGSTVTSPMLDWGYSEGRAWVDFNGDGKADYCRTVGGSNLQSSYLSCTLSNGNSFGQTVTSPLVDWGYADGRTWVDFNGDGRADYCRRVGGSNLQSSHVSCTLSNGSSFGQTVTSPVIDWGYIEGRQWADFNGDGMADYCRAVGGSNLQSSYVSCTLSNGNSFGSTIMSPMLDWGYKEGRSWADFNGDGMADYCRTVGGSNLQSSYLSCTLSKGNGFGSTVTSSMVDWGYGEGRTWADFNGDGMADYCRRVGGTNLSSSYLSCTLSSGESFRETVTSPVVDWGYAEGRAWVDANGDGLIDYCRTVGGKNLSSSYLACTTTRSKDRPKLKTIRESNQQQIQLAYKALTDSSVYTKCPTGSFCQSTYPEQNVQQPLYVVAKIDRSNGIGGTASTVFQYSGMKYNLRGRGSYGFASITQTDLNHDRQTTVTYDQSGFPLIGQVVRTTEQVGGQRVQDVTHTRSFHKNSQGVYRIDDNQSVTRRYELNGNLIRTVTTTQQQIDAYGNVGKKTVVTEGGGERFSVITDNTYSNNVSDWLLGRVTDSLVTYQSSQAAETRQRMRYTYTGQGLVSSESVIGTVSGKTLQSKHFTYNDFGQQTRIRTTADQAAERVSRLGYNTQGQLVSRCNALNECESFSYNAQGWRQSRTGPNGLSTTYGYDGFGRQVLETRADTTQTTTAHYLADSGQCGDLAPFAQACTVSQVSGSAPAIVQYDAFNREVRKITRHFDERDVFQDTEYNALGQAARVSREYYAGDQVYWATSTYDALGRVVQVTEPNARGLDKTITTTYNGLSETVTAGDRNLQTVTHYDVRGKVVERLEEEGASTQFTYTSDGIVKTTTVNRNANTTITLVFDEYGRKTGQHDPDLGHWTYQYNGFDELIRQTNAKGQSHSLEYDQLGRLVKKLTPEGVLSWVFGGTNAPAGSVGKLLTESAPGITKRYQYDTLGRRTQVAASLSNTAQGNTTFTTRTQYDALGRVAKIDYPGGEQFSVEHIYNDNGFLLAVRGLREAAEQYDLAALTPLINQAVDLAGHYQQQAAQLQALGQYYAARAQQLSALTAADQARLSDHAALLQTNVSAGQQLSPAFSGHIHNTLEELARVQTLISGEVASLQDQALQLTILAEQTLAAADHSFQRQRTATQAAALYPSLQDEHYIHYWQAVDVDASGRISAEVYGNGLVNDYAYNQASGQLDSIYTSLLALEPIRDLEYQYDTDNNVTLRHDWVSDIEERYHYDRLDRLREASVASTRYALADLNNTQAVRYDALGNITHKSDVGDYGYGQSGSLHGVRTIGGSGYAAQSYSYDANGNMREGNGRRFSWDSANRATRIIRGESWVSFAYGADGQRYRKTNQRGEETLYIDALYEQTSGAAGSEKIHYIYAAGQRVAEHIVSKKTASGVKGVQTRYLHKDALGSIDLITDAQANVVDRRSFDAWGRQGTLPWQAEATLEDPLFVSALAFTNRGYTGHEHLGEVGLIHMNGRIYDATLGRFISADPFIQDTGSSQSYNRYSYVLNNPMKYTDPSGFFFKKLFKAIKKVVKKIWKPVVALAVGVVTAGAALAAIGAVSTWGAGISAVLSASFGSLGSAMVAGASFGFASSFTGTLLNGGSLEQAFSGGLLNGVIGGLAGGALYGVGQAMPDWFGGKIPGEGQAWFTGARIGKQVMRSAVRGGINGLAAVARGGNFKRGFAGSFISDTIAWGTEALMEWRYRAEVAKLGAKKPFDETVLRAHSHTWRRAKGEPSFKLANESVRDPRVPNVGIPRGAGAASGFDLLTKENGYLGDMARAIPGFNNLSIAHDYWATTLHFGGTLGAVSNLFTSQATIPPFIAGNYWLLTQKTLSNYGGRPY